MAITAANPIKYLAAGLLIGGAMFLTYNQRTLQGYDLNLPDPSVLIDRVESFYHRSWLDAPKIMRPRPKAESGVTIGTVQALAWDYRLPDWTAVEGEPPRDDIGNGPAGSAGSGAVRLLKPVDGVMVAGFGIRMHPIEKNTKLHKGVDIAAGEGTAISAAMGGTVSYAGLAGTLGNAVILEHPGGQVTKYGHMRNVAVKTGQIVSAGQRIGYVGHTGEATGPHLHFEYWLNGKAEDPVGLFDIPANRM